MVRIPPIQHRDQLPPEHQDLYDEILRTRGRVAGAFTIMLHRPEFARRLNALATRLRFASTLEPGEWELAVIAAARETDCHNEWVAHVDPARRGGISEATIDAVFHGALPEGAPESEAQIVSAVQQLLRANRLEAPLFRALEQRFGIGRLCELTATIGYYRVIGALNGAFEVRPAEGDVLPPLKRPWLDPGARTIPPRDPAEPRYRAPTGLTGRVPLIEAANQMAPEDRRHFESIAASRGGTIPGPFTVLLHSPEVGSRSAHVGAYIRFESGLADQERELAICLGARALDCCYVWADHAPLARKAGVTQKLLEAVGSGRAPEGLDQPQADIAAYVLQVLRTNHVEEAVFQPLYRRMGVAKLVDLTATAGYYAMLGTTLNAFEVEPPPGSDVLPGC